MANNVSCHILQAGFTVRSFEWENQEWDEDDHMKDLWWKDEMDPEFGVCNLVRPEHFQGIFAFMGILYSVGLITILWDLLVNPSYKFCSLMIAGLVSCLLVTITNLILFSLVLVTPITYESYNPNIRGRYPYVEILTGKFELNFDIYKNFQNDP